MDELVFFSSDELDAGELVLTDADELIIEEVELYDEAVLSKEE